jgi:hypothetical protein
VGGWVVVWVRWVGGRVCGRVGGRVGERASARKTKWQLPYVVASCKWWTHLLVLHVLGLAAVAACGFRMIGNFRLNTVSQCDPRC